MHSARVGARTDAGDVECAFRLMTPVMECIKAAKGGNKFTIPRTGIRKQMRAEGWDI